MVSREFISNGRRNYILANRVDASLSSSISLSLSLFRPLWMNAILSTQRKGGGCLIELGIFDFNISCSHPSTPDNTASIDVRAIEFHAHPQHCTDNGDDRRPVMDGGRNEAFNFN